MRTYVYIHAFPSVINKLKAKVMNYSKGKYCRFSITNYGTPGNQIS